MPFSLAPPGVDPNLSIKKRPKKLLFSNTADTSVPLSWTDAGLLPKSKRPLAETDRILSFLLNSRETRFKTEKKVSLQLKKSNLTLS